MSTDCPICLNKLEEGGYSFCKSQHVFHKECILNLLNAVNTNSDPQFIEGNLYSHFSNDPSDLIICNQLFGNRISGGHIYSCPTCREKVEFRGTTILKFIHPRYLKEPEIKYRGIGVKERAENMKATDIAIQQYQDITIKFMHQQMKLLDTTHCKLKKFQEEEKKQIQHLENEVDVTTSKLLELQKETERLETKIREQENQLQLKIKQLDEEREKQEENLKRNKKIILAKYLRDSRVIARKEIEDDMAKLISVTKKTCEEMKRNIHSVIDEHKKDLEDSLKTEFDMKRKIFYDKLNEKKAEIQHQFKLFNTTKEEFKTFLHFRNNKLKITKKKKNMYDIQIDSYVRVTDYISQDELTFLCMLEDSLNSTITTINVNKYLEFRNDQIQRKKHNEHWKEYSIKSYVENFIKSRLL